MFIRQRFNCIIKLLAAKGAVTSEDNEWAAVERFVLELGGSRGRRIFSVKACCYFLENESGIGLVYCKRGDGVGVFKWGDNRRGGAGGGGYSAITSPQR